MQLTPDIFSILKDFGVMAAIAIILGYFFIKFIVNQLSLIKGEHDIAIGNIKELTTTIEEMKQKQNRLFDIVEARCGTANCPVIPVVAAKMSELEKSVKTTESRIDTFITELGHEMLINLRERSRTNGVTKSNAK